jgi:hypothetical protein
VRDALPRQDGAPRQGLSRRLGISWPSCRKTLITTPASVMNSTTNGSASAANDHSSDGLTLSTIATPALSLSTESPPNRTRR